MTLFILAYLAGVLTIATPCIVPVLPFVLARADQPFRRGVLPLLLGLAVAFAAVASLAAVAGEWAVAANSTGRSVALALMTLFGVTMLLPTLATRLAAPIVSLGDRLSQWTGQRATAKGATAASSLVLGVATGLVWAPCAGPVLGFILTGAALRGPGVETSLLLLTYGLGAATSLAAGALVGGRLLAAVRQSARWGEVVRRILGTAVVAGAAAIWLGLDTGLLTRLSSATTDTLERGLVAAVGDGIAVGTAPRVARTPAPSSPLRAVLGARQWLGTELRSEDLRGRVVLVSFWTYSCINCLRALPYVRAWAERYRDRGLAVVGVHTPEFAFERDPGNVRQAAAMLGVTWPVAVDNDFAIWREFDNQAWPAFYVIDATGRVRHRALGEGSYDETEQLIQRLLSEAGDDAMAGDIVAAAGAGAQAAPDLGNLRSPETYIGYAQASSFVSPGGIVEDTPRLYRTLAAPPLNRWGLAGVWTIGREFASLNAASGSITTRFHARDLHLVLAPPASGRSIRFRVTIDGAAPGNDHGADVDAEGWGAVAEPRLYQLVRQSGRVAARVFTIEFFENGVRAYAFTFG